MSETEELKAAIRRLQEILDENGISYELEAFGPPDRPQFGPPTMLEHMARLAFKRSVEAFIADNGRMKRDLGFFQGREWSKISPMLRVRLPIDFTVRS